jgi:hypothetical protein
VKVKTLNVLNKIKDMLPELDYEAIQLLRPLVEKRYHETSTQKKEED